ncbi:MAG: hypothetical protein R3B54_00880 [Bdellovibrionota bacterium]
MEKANFGSLDAVGKLKFVQTQMPHVLANHDARIKDLGRAMGTIPSLEDIEMDDDPRWVEFNKAANLILHLPETDPDNLYALRDARNLLYGPLAQRYHKSNTALGDADPILGYAYDFVAAVRAATEAADEGDIRTADSHRQEAAEAAAGLNKAIKDAKVDAAFLQKLFIPTFNFPRKGETVEWERAIIWSQRAGGDSNKSVWRSTILACTNPESFSSWM